MYAAAYIICIGHTCINTGHVVLEIVVIVFMIAASCVCDINSIDFPDIHDKVNIYVAILLKEKLT